MGIDETTAALLDPFEDATPLFSNDKEPQQPQQTESDASRLSDILSGSAEDDLASMKLQMHFILHKLKELHDNCPSNNKISALLEKAAQALKRGKVIEGAQKLQLVLYDEFLEPAIRKRHLEIVEEAKSFL